MTIINGCPCHNRCATLKNSHYSIAMSAEHRSKFAALRRQWWRLLMSEKFSSGTKNPTQTNKLNLYHRMDFKSFELGMISSIRLPSFPCILFLGWMNFLFLQILFVLSCFLLCNPLKPFCVLILMNLFVYCNNEHVFAFSTIAIHAFFVRCWAGSLRNKISQIIRDKQSFSSVAKKPCIFVYFASARTPFNRPWSLGITGRLFSLWVFVYTSSFCNLQLFSTLFLILFFNIFTCVERRKQV